MGIQKSGGRIVAYHDYTRISSNIIILLYLQLQVLLVCAHILLEFCVPWNNNN